MELFYIVIVLALVLVVIAYALMIGHFYSRRVPITDKSYEPNVSIIIPVRNEAKHLPTLLQGLAELDYPKDKLEILIGNDGSNDDTLGILNAHSLSNLKVVEVQQNDHGGNGKVNALIQLTELAGGEYFMFTDGDMQHNKDWVRGMLDGFESGIGLVAGYTSITGLNLWGRIQNIESLLAQGMLKVTADRNHPQSVSGNNMMVTRQAFEAVGGFDEMRNTLVEDVALMRSVVAAGYRVNYKIDSETFASTVQVPSLGAYVTQRRRWMTGYQEVSFLQKFFLIMNGMYMLPVLFILISMPLLGTTLFVLKILASGFFARSILKSVGKSISFLDLMCSELAGPAIALLSLITYYVPGKIRWKGRVY